MNDTTIKVNKKKIGRPATGVGDLVGVRFHPQQLAAIDAWAAQEPDKPSRPEAVRRLVASSLDPVSIVSAAVDRAIAANWAFYNRPSPGGSLWGDIDGLENLEAYRADLASSGGIVDAARASGDGEEWGMTPDEAATQRLVVAMQDALDLTAERPVEAGRSSAKRSKR